MSFCNKEIEKYEDPAGDGNLYYGGKKVLYEIEKYEDPAGDGNTAEIVGTIVGVIIEKYEDPAGDGNSCVSVALASTAVD